MASGFYTLAKVEFKIDNMSLITGNLTYTTEPKRLITYTTDDAHIHVKSRRPQASVLHIFTVECIYASDTYHTLAQLYKRQNWEAEDGVDVKYRLVFNDYKETHLISLNASIVESPDLQLQGEAQSISFTIECSDVIVKTPDKNSVY